MDRNEHEHVIEVTDLRRVNGGGFEAVRGITFSVGRGEIFALLGTNGAGKTSTVELLEGLAPPAGGRVRVLGHDPYRERANVRPRTGVVLQEGGFPSEPTVAETARMWAGCVSGARPEEEALALVGLTGRAGVRFGRDLHDVMGRNLAVIALKSELAVRLARRGRPEAVKRMIEVQRIAQESQREVRAVVRG
ncbi:ATP-binding cassette domain-containing protein [Streptomyces spiralis]